MPIYEYVCHGCESVFTKYTTFTEYDKNKKVKCPHCQKPSTRTIKISPKIKFKGKGFFINDNESKEEQ